MRCFTDAMIRRGLEVVVLGGDRCLVCGGDNDDFHDAQPHAFVPVDLLDLFLEAARDGQPETPDGEGDVA
jgi:hypothetical protein